MKTNVDKKTVINMAIELVLTYKTSNNKEDYTYTRRPIIKKEKTKTKDILNCIHLHKCTKKKIEVNVIFKLDKGGKNIKTIYENMNKLTSLDKIGLEKLRVVAPYLFVENKLESTSEQSEGKKKFIKANKKGLFIRAYKLMGTSRAKVEITGVLGTRSSKIKLVKIMENIMMKIIKGVEGSCKPYYFEAGTELEPLNKYYERMDYKNL